MIQPLRVRNLTVGEGMPKIVVPIVGRTYAEILDQAGALEELPVDIVEWRADFFDKILDLERTLYTLSALRIILGEVPLLLTLRTAREGGFREIEPSYYLALNAAAAQSGCADLVDVEMFGDGNLAREAIDAVHAAGAPVMGSNHEFHHTPPREELLRRLRAMQQMGADVLKLAVMPESRADVLALLAATAEMFETYADRPIATMSMSALGVASRLVGETFGSALTFGSAGQASAPGQLPVEQLKSALEILHQSL